VITPELKLFVTDIDNTLFDWVRYYVASFSALLRKVESIIHVPYATLAAESKVVFEKQGSIEYPFLIQELPSVMAHYGEDIDTMLAEVVAPGRDAFLEAANDMLRPYAGVLETLAEVKRRRPTLAVVALTDAPRYVAMWKMNKLGLLSAFDAVYGLPDPRIPLCEQSGRVKVDPEILHKHLKHNDFGFRGKIRNLPDEYEKPGTRGLKTVLMDYELDDDPQHRRSVLWIGDNRRKDVGLGRRLGVRTAWASYGAPGAEDLRRLSEFSPEINIHKNAAVPIAGEGALPEPDLTLAEFADVLATV
jgi:phosphoglycolate phosphatase